LGRWRKVLNHTVEAHVLAPKFAPLFTEEELEKGGTWLEQSGYRV